MDFTGCRTTSKDISALDAALILFWGSEGVVKESKMVIKADKTGQ